MATRWRSPAGSATLRELAENPPYEQLDLMGDRLAEGLAAAASKHGVPHQVQHVGSMLTLFFNARPVASWPEADRSDRDAFGRYFWGLIDRGVYMPCSQFEALFFSRLHDEALIDQTIDAADQVLSQL